MRFGFLVSVLITAIPVASSAGGFLASGPLTAQPDYVVSCHVVNVGAKVAPHVKVDVVNVTAAPVVASSATVDLGAGARATATFVVIGDPQEFYCRVGAQKSSKALRGSFQVNDELGPIAYGEMR